MNVEIGAVPSWGWRNILEGHKIVEKGLVWRVGHGSSIQIFSDPWLAPPHLCVVPSSEVFNLQNQPLLIVKDLILSNGLLSQTLIRSIFSEGTSQHVLATTIGSGKDKIYWALNKNGLYEVITGYHVAYRLSHPPTEFCPEIMRQRNLWRELWKLKISAKIKIFLWRGFHKKLPVLQKLHHCIPLIQPTCQRCLQFPETINYYIFYYEKSMKI
ncbi:uncharacterized protein [Arachis hypogaea]|uniref:uncharacterized protein n=1 Tax=Arachis hypogaea TaxID=3818 RepID=UPI003B2193C6